MSAPNGARRIKSDHAAVPITPDEIAACAESLREEGVSVLHLHVRDQHAAHTLDAGRYREAINAIRGRVGDDLIVQVTTEAVGKYSAPEQMSLVKTLRPEAVSLALRELCPTKEDESTAAEFFAWLQREKIWPQYILYTPNEVARFDDMRKRGVFSDPNPFCLFVLGRYTEKLQGNVDELHKMMGATDCREFPWAVCCFGRAERDAAVTAAENGGHVRIGFENNLLRADGTVASDNAQLVIDFFRARKDLDREPATADDIRNSQVWG